MNTRPEEYILQMLIEVDGDDEIITCAKRIANVDGSQNWITEIGESRFGKVDIRASNGFSAEE